MSRSKWKGIFVDKFLLYKKDTKKIKIWSRQSTILKHYVGQFVYIHTGKEFKKIFITREKIGFKFGQFCFTRKHTRKTKNLKGTKKNKTKK